MNRKLAMIGAIVRKDLLQLWPIALGATVLIALYIYNLGTAEEDTPQLIRALLPIVAYVAGALVIVFAIHADAPAGVRHEWLTRPVPRQALVVAKCIFIIAAVLLPVMIGRVLAGVREGYPWQEILSVATSIDVWMVTSVLALCVVAAMTQSVLGTAVIAIAGLVAAQLLVPVVYRLSGTGEEIYITGASWIADQPRGVFFSAMAIALLWLMYAHRRTRLALMLFAAGVALLIFSPQALPWRTVFAIQRSMSPSPEAAQRIRIERDGTCLPAIVVNPPASDASAADDPAWSNGARPKVLSSSQYTQAQRRSGGGQAIGFETRVALTGSSQDWRALVTRVDASYIAPDGRVLRELRPARYTPELTRVDAETQIVSHFWLLPRATGEELEKSAVKLNLDYSVSLLQATQSTELPVNAPRRYIAGFGHCGAEFDRTTSTITVDCFKRGAQPALLTANLVGASADIERASDYPDFTPTLFRWPGGKRHVIALRNVPEERATRLTLATYQPRAHFNRAVEFDGVLGGARADACPLPRQ